MRGFCPVGASWGKFRLGMAGEVSSVGFWCVPLGQSFVVVRQARLVALCSVLVM